MQTLPNPERFYVLLYCQQTFAKVCKLCQCILTSPLIEGPLSTAGGGAGCAISPLLSDFNNGIVSSSDNGSLSLGSDSYSDS